MYFARLETSAAAKAIHNNNQATQAKTRREGFKTWYAKQGLTKKEWINRNPKKD